VTRHGDVSQAIQMSLTSVSASTPWTEFGGHSTLSRLNLGLLLVEDQPAASLKDDERQRIRVGLPRLVESRSLRDAVSA